MTKAVRATPHCLRRQIDHTRISRLDILSMYRSNIRSTGSTAGRGASRIVSWTHRPTHQIEGVNRLKVRDLLGKSDALLACWNEGWDTKPSDCWWICCDNHDYNLDRLPRRGRRGARQGLTRCAVRQVNADCLREQGYAIYVAAHVRYPSHVRPAPAAEFADE